MRDIQIVHLKNGKRVANFSSPHNFKFDDGTVLPAVSTHIATNYSVKFRESEIDGREGDKKISYYIPRKVWDRMEKFEILYKANKLDVVFISLPMMLALRDNGWSDKDLIKSPYRTIRTIGSRLKKVISSEKQAI